MLASAPPRLAVLFLAVIASLCVVGCYDRKQVPRSSDDPAVDTLFRHLNLTRWARPLVRGGQYEKAELVYIVDGNEKLVTSLTLGKNIDETFGMVEVLLQRLENNEYKVSVHHLEKSTALSTSAKKFQTQRGFSLWGMGEKMDPWDDENLLGAEGKSGASSRIDDPMNLEKLVLRFVGKK
ncbi:MAG: hypothetical protein AAF488_02955 [Planctomycetota bacterium]